MLMMVGELRMSGQPKADWTAYRTIIIVAIVLCAAWLITGSFWLTMAVIILELLHLAKEFPAAEAVIAQDPLLLGLRRAAPLIILGIFGFVLVNRFLWM